MTVPIKGGAPRRFPKPADLQKPITKYFKTRLEEGKQPFLTDLYNYLDITSDTWSDYTKLPEYTDVIKKARQLCEAGMVQKLLEGKVNPTGTIFVLKNHYGWRDRTETDITSGGEKISFTNTVPRPTDES